MFATGLLKRRQAWGSLLVMLLLLLVVGTGLYLKRTELRSELRAKVQQELVEQGLFIEFGSLRYDLLRGLIMKDARFFPNTELRDAFAQFDRITIQIDKTKALRGVLRLERLNLEGGKLSVKIDPSKKRGASVEISEIQGEILFPTKRLIEFRRMSGTVGQLDLTLRGLLGLGERGSDDSAVRELIVRRRKFGANLSTFLGSLVNKEGSEIGLSVSIDGELDKPALMNIDLEIIGSGLNRGGVQIEEISARGQLEGDLLLISELILQSENGLTEADAIYSLRGGVGECKLNSSQRLRNLVALWTGEDQAHLLPDSEGDELQASINFQSFPQKKVEFTGVYSASEFRPKPEVLNDFRSKMLWKDGQLLLSEVGFVHRGLKVTHEQAKLIDAEENLETLSEVLLQFSETPL